MSRQMLDNTLDWYIDVCLRGMVEATEPDDKRAFWNAAREAINARSPREVEQMELEKGLR